jgi:hypothetical protein
MGNTKIVWLGCLIRLGVNILSQRQQERVGDPKECRQHALNCMLEAKAARTAQARDNFAKLARSWIKLAEELERMQSMLAEADDFYEPEDDFEPMERAG